MGFATFCLVLMILVLLVVFYGWAAAGLAFLGMAIIFIWVLDAWGKQITLHNRD